MLNRPEVCANNNYDLAPVWRSAAMEALRGSIKRKECACPMANANYANMLLHPPTVTKVMLDVVQNSVKELGVETQSSTRDRSIEPVSAGAFFCCGRQYPCPRTVVT